MNLNIVTRCTRPENLKEVSKNIEFARTRCVRNITLTWIIIVDTSVTTEWEFHVMTKYLSYERVIFWEGIPGDLAHSLLNKVLDILPSEDWVYFLDDDNILHPDFMKVFLEKLQEFPEKGGFIFSQKVGGVDFSGLDIREAKPENVRVQGIDMAQFILKMETVGNVRFVPEEYTADGIFISEIYNANPLKFVFFPKVLCYYNKLKNPVSPKAWTLPRVLLLDDERELKSDKWYDFESDEIRTETANNDNAQEKIASFNPDTIITFGEDFVKYSSLTSLPLEFRQRWIHIPDSNTNVGEIAYQCAMSYIMHPNWEDTVSIFTPIYNTGEKLKRTYQSILSQIHMNWEWVLVNDSTDNITLSIAEEIASKDPRVKVYDFKSKSKGIIGEAKYRACVLSNGNYLLELDHDDYLLPHALSKIVSAFQAFPDAGFVYTDCAEIDENYNSLTYGDSFAFSYGKYREENHLGITFKVADTANINPITIRHIVGVPNHIRAWRRAEYFQTGGHNRRLSITDDYELVVKTFLITKMVKIPLCCYLQFYHENNSQNATRSDIQRRVRTISMSYNNKINQRFKELGKEDWAYTDNGMAWGIPSRFGKEENYVNYIYDA